MAAPTRSCGILLHPTSLPGRFGIGGLGGEARRFVEFLSDARQSLWQVLPLGPTGYGDSPYQSFSAFAGNPLLVDPELLLQEGLLAKGDLADPPAFPEDRVDYGAVIPYRSGLLDGRLGALERRRRPRPGRLRGLPPCRRVLAPGLRAVHGPETPLRGPGAARVEPLARRAGPPRPGGPQLGPPGAGRGRRRPKSSGSTCSSDSGGRSSASPAKRASG